jgi:hypothetical protein
MKEWLTFVTEYAILVIDALALVIIVVGTIEAFIGSLTGTPLDGSRRSPSFSRLLPRARYDGRSRASARNREVMNGGRFGCHASA